MLKSFYVYFYTLKPFRYEKVDESFRNYRDVCSDGVSLQTKES